VREGRGQGTFHDGTTGTEDRCRPRGGRNICVGFRSCASHREWKRGIDCVLACEVRVNRRNLAHLIVAVAGASLWACSAPERTLGAGGTGGAEHGGAGGGATGGSAGVSAAGGFTGSGEGGAAGSSAGGAAGGSEAGSAGAGGVAGNAAGGAGGVGGQSGASGTGGCAPNGTACSDPASCCSAHCIGSACGDCVKSGGKCKHGSDCCHHQCNPNTPYYTCL